MKKLNRKERKEIMDSDLCDFGKLCCILKGISIEDIKAAE